MKFMKYTIAALLLVVLAAPRINAQDNGQTYKLKEDSKMMVYGTSTIHDWEVETSDLQGSVTINTNSDMQITDASITVPVEKMESGKGGMDKKMYGALDKKKHPNITYKLTNASIDSMDTDAQTFKVNTTGDLTIAGTTRSIEMTLDGKKAADGSYGFTGSKTINMTDYKVDPPSAVFGTIKSGEEVTIKFDLTFTK